LTRRAHLDDGLAVRAMIGQLLPERLQRLQRVSGVPVVFGGSTEQVATESRLVITRLAGTLGVSLRGLAVPPGRGLGGTVLRHGAPRLVDDYATDATITHDYDRIVVEEERLTSVFAVPVTVHGAVHGVLYGAVREGLLTGDRALRSASIVAAHLQRDIEGLLRPEPQPEPSLTTASAALVELADVIHSISDPALRERLNRILKVLRGEEEDGMPTAIVLSPRELDVLRLVAVGESNLEIAAQLGLSPETVRAYLRAAMRKLGVRNRTAAVHAVRCAGILWRYPAARPVRG
jgi:LuxR family transcriptional regulator, regulator of acetate metabolism